MAREGGGGEPKVGWSGTAVRFVGSTKRWQRSSRWSTVAALLVI